MILQISTNVLVGYFDGDVEWRKYIRGSNAGELEDLGSVECTCRREEMSVRVPY